MIRIKDEAPQAAVTKPAHKRVTIVTKSNKGGRPKIHVSRAEKQRVYRERKRKGQGA